ncbi:MAG: glycosyltransferase [Solirubrobacterales bacterium]
MNETLRIAFFGSSLVSAYWNGAATYYRGIIQALHDLGHRITFYEPDAFDRQRHRDLESVSYAHSVVYQPDAESVTACLNDARLADVVVKCSGVGVLDAMLEEAVLDLKDANRRVVFWDVDAPATLERVGADHSDPFRKLIPDYDLIFTYGGGDPVVRAYKRLGARQCIPIYNALTPSTHHPVEPQDRFEADLAFCGNRMPDREGRVAEFFLKPACLLPKRRFLLGGNGWDAGSLSLPNIRYVGHVYTADHNAFNATPLAVLNVCRESMARFGFSPPTRIFEAAGAAACIITDNWQGLELFLKPGVECIAADSGQDVARALDALTVEQARHMGDLAQRRVLVDHTYAQRARQVEQCLLASPRNRMRMSCHG